jgi:alkanesulfonate monooxygenase SsuD/methylene tetrahydromethanopterin reductase-like flavin-dependent oxidoreductase (luciferase family)
MVGLHVVAADTDAEAKRLFTSQQQSFTNLRRGQPGPQQPPIDDIEAYWTPAEKLQASHMLQYAVVGSAETVKVGLERILAETQADEFMVVSAIYDHAARLRSYEILAEVAKDLERTPPLSSASA